MSNPKVARMAGWALQLMSARGVGHTQLMLEGLKQYEGSVLLVAHTKQHADLLANEVRAVNPKIQIQTTGLDNHATFRGSRMAVAWDNSALLELFRALELDSRTLQAIRERLERTR